MNVIESKGFNEVMEYMKEYFQHSKHYLFSNTIDTVTKSDGRPLVSVKSFAVITHKYISINAYSDAQHRTLANELHRLLNSWKLNSTTLNPSHSKPKAISSRSQAETSNRPSISTLSKNSIVDKQRCSMSATMKTLSLT